ncbi:MAG TPA: glycosyltransferase family 39 protein [bacterium]|nr:glycosyltransferase family 39 protein [bacterium]
MHLKSNNKILFLIITIAVFLRFCCLSQKDFWCDEFLAISFSRIPSFLDMIKSIIKYDAHPPLFYSIIRWLFQFTQSEFGLRFIPFLSGAGAVVIFYLLLTQEKDKNYLLPLTLFAFSPAAILWSQIVKSYSMLTFFSLLSVLLFLLYQNTYKFKYGAGWVIASLITLYLHNYGVIVIAGQVIVLLFYRKEVSLRKFCIPLAVIFLLYLPYLAGPLFSQIAFVKTAPHSVINPFFRIAYTFFYFVFGETLSPLNFKFVLPGIILFLLFFIRGAQIKKDFLQNFSIIVLALGIIMVFSIKATIPQNLVHLQPFFFIVIASGVEGIRKESVKKLFSVILVLFLIPSLYYYYRKDSLQYHDISKLIPFRKVSQIIQNEEKPNEVIIINELRERRFSEFFEPYSPWDWYYKGNLPVVEVTPENTEDLENELKRICSKYNGFWLILKYSSAGQQWNEDIKNFFIREKSVKIRDMQLIKNYSFLDVLKGKEKKEYYFLEIYHFINIL